MFKVPNRDIRDDSTAAHCGIISVFLPSDCKIFRQLQGMCPSTVQ